MDPNEELDDKEGILKRIAANIETTVKDIFNLEKAFANAFQNMTTIATDLNKRFTQGRERITEMNYVIAQSIPEVKRLGGTAEDTFKIFDRISEATSRNVLASVQDVRKLYSAGKLLNEDVGAIVGKFQDVGVQFSQVGGQLQTSIDYVRSIGGNAGQIMKDVVGYMDQMNRYNFSDGVLGLTKMATQAALLRYDMGQTVALTERALTPEGAIDLAAAFQRLGVAAGDLVDPFQLMNKSINDPQGLQDSIINVAKQYSYFDEKSKTFRINPQGILMLKELQDQTGLNAKEMSKLAVNAADLDRKLRSLSPTIEFKNPEDKMYLANIAKMGTDGEYEVTINDKETRKLTEITQSELNRLIEEQKKPPKTLEDLTRDQVDFTKLLVSDVEAIRDKFVYGMTSAEIIRKELEGLRRGATTITGYVSDQIPQRTITDKIDETLSTLGTKIEQIMTGELDLDIKEVFKDLGSKMTDFLPYMEEKQKKALGDLISKVTPNSFMEKGLLDYILKPIENAERERSANASPVKNDGSSRSESYSNSKTISESSTRVEIGGNGVPITLKLDVPPGISQEYFQNFLRTTEFSDKIIKYVEEDFLERGYIKKKN